MTEYPDRIEGTQADPGKPLLTLHGRRRLLASIAVPEKEISEVRVGSLVELKFQSYPDLTFTATVSEIAPVVSVPKLAAFRENYVRVDGEVLDPGQALKPGMTGHARIICGRRTVWGLVARRLMRWIKVEFWW